MNSNTQYLRHLGMSHSVKIASLTKTAGTFWDLGTFPHCPHQFLSISKDKNIVRSSICHFSEDKNMQIAGLRVVEPHRNGHYFNYNFSAPDRLKMVATNRPVENDIFCCDRRTNSVSSQCRFNTGLNKCNGPCPPNCLLS